MSLSLLGNVACQREELTSLTPQSTHSPCPQCSPYHHRTPSSSQACSSLLCHRSHDIHPTLTTTFPLPPLPPLTFPPCFPYRTVENPSSFHVVIGYASAAIVASIIVVSVVGGGVTPMRRWWYCRCSCLCPCLEKENGSAPRRNKI